MANSFKIDWRATLSRYAPLIFWIGVILFLSSPQGSMVETSRFITPILHFLFPAAPDETIAVYHGYIRKTAHFTEYALLAFFAVRAFARSSIASLRNLKYLPPLILVALVASTDEFNQSFEASRTGSFLDILLDLSGGAAMLFLVWIFDSQTKEHRRGQN